MRKIHRAIFWFYNIEQNIVKNRKQYLCETCHYVTSNLFDFIKHNTTRKHLVNKESNRKIAKNRNNIFAIIVANYMHPRVAYGIIKRNGKKPVTHI